MNNNRYNYPNNDNNPKKEYSINPNLKIRGDAKIMEFANINCDLITKEEKKEIRALVKKIRYNLEILKNNF